MKKVLFLNLILLIVIACSKNEFNHEGLKSEVLLLNQDSIARMNSGAYLSNDLTSREIDSISKIASIISPKLLNSTVAGPEYTDASGLIHLRLFWNDSPASTNWPHIEVTVDQDYVVVGGGAATYDWIYPCFLTESRPDPLLTKWIASSKDHLNADPHKLTVYAIGMKIDGVSTEYLRSKIHLYSASSIQANHPKASIRIPSNCILLGGGAYDDWRGQYGNMLTASYPSEIDNYTWLAEGKDHRRPDPSIITAYAIGIENISFPGVGYLQVNRVKASAYAQSGVKSLGISAPSNSIQICCGGICSYANYGRMLTKLYPNSLTQATMESSDTYSYGDSGHNYIYLINIQSAK
jgi:hypothetical protein